MLMISGLHTATGQSYVTYGLYGEYEEDPKSYFLRVQFNFIDADAPNEDAAWWEVGGYDLSNMPKPLVEALYNFTTHCNEAGFLAVELLRRNGVEAAVQCNSPSPAMAQQNSGGPQAKELHHRQDRISAAFFPNPTQGTLQVVLSEGTDRASLILYNLQGQPAFQAVLTGQRTTLQLPVPAGIYWARLQIAGQQPVHHKIIVSR